MTHQAQSIVATGLPNPARNQRQVFVAYPYTLYDKADYRRPFKDLARAFDVQFVFADEKITTLHILQKIADYIRSSRCGIYDISGWNANVTLELGLAYGLNEKAYIIANPKQHVAGRSQAICGVLTGLPTIPSPSCSLGWSRSLLRNSQFSLPTRWKDNLQAFGSRLLVWRRNRAV